METYFSLSYKRYLSETVKNMLKLFHILISNTEVLMRQCLDI